MIWPLSSILFLFALQGVMIAVSTLKEYRTVQGRDLGMILISTSVASFSYGMEILSPGLQEKFIWVVVRYFALTLFTLINALFVFYFTRISIQLKSWRFLFLCLTPAIALISLAAYPYSQLVYSQIWLDTSGPIPMLGKSVGPLYGVLNLYNVGLLVIQIILVLNNMAHESVMNRKQSMVVAAALILVVVTHLIHLAGFDILGVINPNLLTYFPVAALILWGTKRYRLADLRPIARTRLLEQLQDGILVVDQSGSLIDINPAATNYLLLSGQAGIGKTLQSVSNELAGILQQHSQKKGSSEIRLKDIPMQVITSPLVVRSGEAGGFLIILRDISDRVEAEELRKIEIERQSAWKERQYIARTLHDSINQYLNSLVLFAGAARDRLDQKKFDQIGPVIDHISTSARQASKELRALITELQLESPSDQSFDLLKALSERVKLINDDTDLCVKLDKPDSIGLNSSQQREIFYILLEALNNILQHARADTVSICLQETDSQFITEISDNGCGFDPKQARKGGMGLANIRARARQLDGVVSIESTLGSGTCLHLVLPFSRISKLKE